jgi:DNA-binding LacI/PurR family transcriptional regulator
VATGKVARTNGTAAGQSLEGLREQLLEGLRGAGLRRGEVLPSLREISGRYGVTKAAAERALRSLVDEGVCYTEPGRGAFMAVDSAELVETSTLAFVFGVYEYPRTGVAFYRDVYEGFQDWIFDAGHNVVKFYEWRSKSRPQKTREWAQFSDRVTGVGVLGVYADGDCMLLRNSGLPVVVMDYDTQSLGVDCAVLDCAGSMRRLGRALFERGASDVFFVRAAWGATSPDPASEERRRGLKTAASEAGVALDAERVINVAGREEQGELQRLAAATRELERAGKTAAVVCEDGGLAPRVAEALASAGLRAGDGYLLGYTSGLEPAGGAREHKATLAAFDFRALGRMGGDLLAERMKRGAGRPARALLKEEIRDWSPQKDSAGGSTQ